MGKLGTNYILFGIAMATILGVFAMTTATDDTLTITATAPQLLGHITMTVTDSDGDIKSYVQTDNIVTTAGLHCALVALFDPGTGAECLNDSASPFKYIVLGSNSTDFEALTDDSDDFGSDNEVARKLADDITQETVVIFLNATFAAGEAGSNDNTLQELEVVGETALFDDGTQFSGNMLSRVTLPPTEVVDGDSIFISWKITGSTP